MSVLAQGMHSHTPTLAVVDPRGLAVRVVAYCRSIEMTEPEERINRSAYDAMGRLIEQWDPRLWALSAEDHETPANVVNRYSLSGKVLGAISVDAGERISLFGDGDQLVQAWDSRGSERQVEYDDLLRPLAIFEQGEGEAARCAERYEYADADAGFAAHNQCGQLIRHDDPAGTQTMDEYALIGGVLEQTQRFLSSLELPDWPPGLPARDALLEPVEQAATSATHFNPLGDVLEQTDAKGNRQLFDYTVDGQLLASHLQLSGQAAPQTLVSAIAYSAYVQVEQETAGNGVVSTLMYRPEDGRLIRLQARHGTEAALQDLHYDYDPVGNVLSIEDDALPTRYFSNQRVEPVKSFTYDSLYQLIKATGWEAGSASRGPGFNRFDDPGTVANYHQTYRYDAGGNLLELVHVGPQSHSRKLTAARYSNRCMPEQNGRPPTEEEIAAAFDGNGNLLDLQPGQAMSWDLRNQLREVRPVEREDADDDRELYLYGGDGMRRRKVRSTQTNARSLISEVRYLPGLEIRTREGPGEVLQVICVQAGRSALQVLHWETAPPAGITNDQYRYNLTDHLGSSSLELDSEAEVISQEAYHPYGSTAWFAGRSEVEASYKIVRYSGKERDATGLYYYGYRYYQPWAGRWLSADPAGTVDGLNLYRMGRNSPVTYYDNNGLNPTITHFDEKDVEGLSSVFLSIKEGLNAEGISPEQATFIIVGRSPQMLGEFISESGFKTALLQISGLGNNKKMPDYAGLDVSAKSNRENYLQSSLGEALAGTKHAVLMDYSVTGSSIVEVQKMLASAFPAVNFKMAIISRFLNDQDLSQGEKNNFHHQDNILFNAETGQGRLNYENRGVMRVMKTLHHEIDKGLSYTEKFPYTQIDSGGMPKVMQDRKERLSSMMSDAIRQYGDVTYTDAKNRSGQRFRPMMKGIHAKYASTSDYIDSWNYKRSRIGSIFYGAKKLVTGYRS